MRRRFWATKVVSTLSVTGTGEGEGKLGGASAGPDAGILVGGVLTGLIRGISILFPQMGQVLAARVRT